MGSIYGIVCPKTKNIVYVGKTKNTIEARFKGHKSGSTSAKVYQWFCQMDEDGLIDFVDCICLEDNIEENNLSERERFWINHYANGGLLLNIQCNCDKKRNSLSISGLTDETWAIIQAKKIEVLGKQTTCSTAEAIDRVVLGDEKYETIKTKAQA